MEAAQELPKNQTGTPDDDQIECRPCCGKCDLLAVYKDFDPIQRMVSIACMTCGNRYPGGHKFYMKEVDVKKPCKNCFRVKSIVRHGMCFTCGKAYDSAPEGPARDKALAEVKTKIDAGDIKTRGTKPADVRTKKIRAVHPDESPASAVASEMPIKLEANPLLPIHPVNIKITLEGSSLEHIFDEIQRFLQMMTGSDYRGKNVADFKSQLWRDTMKAKDSTLETPQDNLISIPKFSVKEVSKVVFGGFAVDRFLFSKPDKLPLRSQTLPQAMIACANKGKGWHLFTAFQWSAMAYLWKKATSLDDCICDLHPEVWQWIMGLFMDGNGHVDILASLEVSYAGSPYGRGTIRGAEGSTPKIVCDGKGNNWLKNWRPGAFDGMKVYIAEAGNGDGEFFPITVTSETTITLPRGANPGKGPATFCIVRHVASDVTHGMISGNKITTLRESDADLKAFAIPAASNNQGSVDLGYDRFWFYKTSSLRAAVRGGSFYYEAGAGVFALHLGNAPSYSYCNIGFRAGKAL